MPTVESPIASPALSPAEQEWHQQAVATVLARLETAMPAGLPTAEGAARLARYGPNTIRSADRRSPWRMLAAQFLSTMVVILIVAAGAALVLGDYKDTAVIAAIIVLNALLGFQQEYRAEQALVALRKLAVPQVRVRRDGVLQTIPAAALVPGDLVLLEAGNLVPADARVIESMRLRVQEAALTGESEPVEKDPAVRPGAHLPLGDRQNMVYLGTQVTYGRGQVVVTATGMQTELGRIATLVQTARPGATPLQRRLDQLGRGVAAAALALVGVIAILGLLRGEDWRLLFLTAVSVAVAAVPEGLPAVVTIALALGAQRMLARRALIRKLPAVETLGSVTVICTDKTGTLTANQMTVTALDVAGQQVDWPALLREAMPLLDPQAIGPAPLPVPDLDLVLIGGALCNDATLQAVAEIPGEYQADGDPTEGALLVAAARRGFGKAGLDRAFPRVAEVPFDSERKRMTTVHQVTPAGHALLARTQIAAPGSRPLGAAGWIAVTKGAGEGLLACCRAAWVNGRPVALDPPMQQRIETALARLAGQGMRVLGVAVRPLVGLPDPGEGAAVERDLLFVGLIGLQDPVRPEVHAAVATCRTAGIRPVMITGDHPLTAQAIAADLGIGGPGEVLTGAELDALAPAALLDVVGRVSVYARVSPEHKLRIVQALQQRGEIVAMTGDGVNDAPALKQADIGVAMGLAGTDVAKEAADTVLLDDNFATIVAAVEEGRVIYDNVRKFIKYILAGNIGELGVMLLAPLVGMPLPLLPLQILWINLVTDGLPALALGVEPAERDAMRRPPPRPTASIFGQGLGWDILGAGLLTALLSLGLGWAAWASGQAHWQTLVFTTLALTQMALALAVRSERDSLFRRGLLTNRPLLGAILLTVALQGAVVYLPFLQDLFHTAPLALHEVALSLALSSVVFWALEGKKWFLRRRERDRAGRSGPQEGT